MTYLMSDIIKFLSNVSIGIGLTYSSMVFLMILSLFFPLNNVTGWIAWLGYVCAFGFAYFYVYKKSFKFDSLMILKSCLGVFFIALFTLVLMFNVSSIPISLPSFFAVSAFLAIGLIGIFGDRKYRKLGFCFLTLSLLFLICVPIVNVWQIRAGYGDVASPFYYSAIYSVYTIPLILTSFSFFVLGTMLILYKKSQTKMIQNMGDTKVIEQEDFKLNSTCNTFGETNGVEKFKTNFKNLGFSFMVFSQLSFIWAAIVYAQRGLRSWEFSTHPISSLQFVVIGVVLFVLGYSFMLKKSRIRAC